MPCPSESQNKCANLITYLNSEFQLSRTNGSRNIEKWAWQLFWSTPHPSEMQNYCTNLLTYLHSKFQLSRTNGSRVIEKGCGITFEVSHALLNHRIAVQIWLPSYLPNFSFLGPMVLELLKKGCGSTFEISHALMSCRTTVQIWLPTYIPNFSFQMVSFIAFWTHS